MARIKEENEILKKLRHICNKKLDEAVEFLYTEIKLTIILRPCVPF